MIISPPASRIVVILPTKNRPSELNEAISTVYAQTHQPHLLIVVGESDSDFDILIDYKDQPSRIEQPTLLVNERAKNLSGAINTAIKHLLELEFEPDRTYMALLDDDDRWDSDYLHKCFSTACEENADWVVSGITRHETQSGSGTDLNIPEELTASAFLTTNPHVQGSNIFVRLSTLLRAGCFDENLQSTTDRDLGVRLLNLGNTKVGFVREHLVHHIAYSHDRLSTPGSQAKRNGLVAFYHKYSPIMSSEERSKFLHRASTLFHCKVTDFMRIIGGSN
jgi:glycosyltransferase involved in cell wall biosynthesis